MIAETFTIARRFRGPSQSGNGGYVCGRLARHVAGPALVRLRAPPPLDVLGPSELPASPPTTSPATAPPTPASSDRRVTSR